MQIWTNAAQPFATRFYAIGEYYKKNLYGQPDSVILLTDYIHDDKKHMGPIDVKDKEPKGTKFIINLPMRVESISQLHDEN